MKEIHSKLPDETAVAVELRKEKEREEDKKDYGRTDQPAVNVTLSSDSDSDSDAPTVGRGGNSDDEFTPINLMLEEDAEGVIARTIRLSLSAAVADTAKETRDEEVSVEEKRDEEVEDSAEEKRDEEVSAAVAMDSKDDGTAAVAENGKTDTNQVEPLTKRDEPDTNLVEPPPKLTTVPSTHFADYSVSDDSDDPGLPAEDPRTKAAEPPAETKDGTRPKVFLQPACKGKAKPPIRSRGERRYRSRSGRRYRSRSGRRSSSRSRRCSCSRSGCRNRSRGGRRSRSRSGRHNRKRSESSARSLGRFHCRNRKGRGRATTIDQLSERTTTLSQHDGLDRNLIPRAAMSSLPDDELAPAVDCNLMLSQWVLGKQCDARDFANKIRDCPMDVVCVALTKSVGSRDAIFKFLEHLAHGTQKDDALLQPQSRLTPNDEFQVSEVLREKIVLHLRPGVWIVVNRCKVKKVSFIENGYRSGGNLSNVSFGHVTLHMNRSRQRMPEINIGVLNAHKAVTPIEKAVLWQWLAVRKIAVLCSFYPKGPNAQSLASSLGAHGAVGCGPCLQEVVHEPCSRGNIETKTHPSYITCYGYCHKMKWPEQAAYASKLFLGSDLSKELVTARVLGGTLASGLPSWKENWLGRNTVPHLGSIKQKMQNMSMWCRYSFQNCVWLGQAIPSKQKREQHAAFLAQQQTAKKRKLQENADRSRGTSTRPQDYFTAVEELPVSHPWWRPTASR